MLTFFKPHKTTLQNPLPLLTKQELAELRLASELLDSSHPPSHTLDSQQAGWLPTKPLGSGMDYAESRVYQAGDEPRHINWRLSARSQDTFVKTFHMESRPSLCIVLDQRRTMIFGTQQRLKITQALRAAALLAYACESQHITLHILILKDEVLWLPDQSVDSFLTLANKPCIATKMTTQPSWSTAFLHLQQHSQQTSRNLPKGSLIYLISDFYDLQKSHQSDLIQFKEHHFVQAIHIMDNAELRLPQAGRVHLQAMQHEDSSSPLNNHPNPSQRYSLKTQNKKAQKQFSKLAEQHAENIRNRIIEAGVSYTRLMTKEDNIQLNLSLPLGHT